MVRKQCCIPGCYATSDTRNSGMQPNNALFEFPKQPVILVVWLDTLSKLGAKVNAKSVVCERHFYHDDVDKKNKTVKLKPTAVPCLKLKPMSYYWEKYKIKGPLTYKRLLESYQAEIRYKEQMKENRRKREEAAITAALNQKNYYDQSISIHNDVSFEDMCVNLHLIAKPSDWWSVNCTENGIFCAKWNKDYKHVKKVVIEKDFKAKVFVNELQVNITDGLHFRSLKTVSTLLKIVEDINLD